MMNLYPTLLNKSHFWKLTYIFKQLISLLQLIQVLGYYSYNRLLCESYRNQILVLKEFINLAKE